MWFMHELPLPAGNHVGLPAARNAVLYYHQIGKEGGKRKVTEWWADSDLFHLFCLLHSRYSLGRQVEEKVL